MNVYCERCQTAAATVHVTDLEGVKKIERHLCEDCANSLGLPLKNAQGLSMLEVFQQFMEKSSSGRRRGDRACPECGMTFTEFKQKGRFGCSRDYDEFLSRLVPLLQRIHGAAEHTEGAAAEPEPPKRRSKAGSVQSELRKLRRELQRVVEHEEYEEAARIRDRIKSLEQILSGGEAPG